MTKKLTLTSPPDYQCYDCVGCGDCCRGIFAITVTHEDRERILKQGWADDPLFRDIPLFQAHGDEFLLGHRADGSCVFLDERGLCSIHARFGEPAKPLGCRLYPFIFVPVGNQIRVDLRYDCPAAAANRGRALPKHRAALLGLLPLVVPERAQELPVPALYDGVQLNWTQLCRITETYERLLLEESLNLTQRIICAVQLTGLLRTPKIAELEGRELTDFLEVVTIRVVAAIAEAPMPRVRPPRMVMAAFRQVAGIYGREDRRGERGQLLTRLGAAIRLLAGHGLVPRLRPDTPAVPFAALEEAAGVPAGEVAGALIRYYRLRLASMGFFGRAFYQRDYLEGMGALLLTYPLLLWFARLEARGRGLAAPDVDAAFRALQIVDHQHGRTPALDLPSEHNRTRFLTERSHLRALVVWYGS